MLEPAKTATSLNINYVSTQPDQPQPDQPQSATKLSQVTQSQSARARSSVSQPVNGRMSLDEIVQSGGLRVVTGYKQSLKGWVSSKIADGLQAIRGKQAAFSFRDRPGTFRALERLASNVHNTAIFQHDDPTTKAAHQKSVVAFRDAFQQYVDSKPGKLSHESAILADLDETISQLEGESSPDLAVPSDTHSGNIRGITPEQKTRLAELQKHAPLKAAEVVRRTGGDATDLDLILADAASDTFETRSIGKLVAEKRAQLTGPKSEGGLGINPKDLKSMGSIGNGHFGAVKRYEYKDPETGATLQFAGKVLNKSQANQNAFDAEEAMLARLPKHENLVKSYGVHEIDGEQVLLQELVPGGDLKKILEKFGTLLLPREQQHTLFLHVARQVFTALEELQKLGIAHDDVRADNLLFDTQTLGIKLGDFGLASARGIEVNSKTYPARWASPEIILNAVRRESITGDSFAVSRVLVGELVDHMNLFNKSGKDASLDQFENEDVTKVLVKGEKLPEELPQETRAALDKIDSSGKMAEFFQAISHPDPEKRLRADKALKHEFLINPPSTEELNKLFRLVGIVLPLTDDEKSQVKGLIYS